VEVSATSRRTIRLNTQILITDDVRRGWLRGGQVLTRRGRDGEELTVVHTQTTMPTLEQVASDILPRAAARTA
jgi:hypothetical protein